MKILIGVIVGFILLFTAANVAENNFGLALILVLLVGIIGAYVIFAIFNAIR